ncbi:MAG: transposase [Saprospiraceae bacterium]|nr:transposase [Candidatus Parvibacillus calidus]
MVLKKCCATYAGHLQCDGYTVYDDIAAKRDEITLLGCLVHARRYLIRPGTATMNEVLMHSVCLERYIAMKES